MASLSHDDGNTIIPAQLAFLAIYNPSLGRTDETFRDQVVFYHSRQAHLRKKRNGELKADDPTLQQEENEQLRQIGLAQGMVGFAQNFANGSNVDTVETEKSRIILHELEPGWWILASIDYTRLPLSQMASKTGTNSTPADKDGERYEYSSREISLPALLLQQLVQTNNIFKLHNGSSLEAIFKRNGRSKFCALLERFWTRFALNWNVMLHGLPAVEVFGGMQLAAGGELGVGLGEEEWGCGEREVLEDFAARNEGLVDLVVCRFGDARPKTQASAVMSMKQIDVAEPWLGIGNLPQSADGVVFSGIGAVARPFMRDITSWLRLIYTYGENAYAVKESSASAGKRRKHKDRTDTAAKSDTNPEATRDQPEDPPAGIPRSIVSAAEKSLQSASSKAEKNQPERSKSPPVQQHLKQDPKLVPQDETWKKIMKFGYGYSWGLGDDAPVEAQQAPDKMALRIRDQIKREDAGYFLIGLQGDLNDDIVEPGKSEGTAEHDWDQRVMVRTIHVPKQYQGRPELPRLGTDDSLDQPPSSIASGSVASTSQSDTVYDKSPRRVRVLVYVHRPFIYALLFRTDTSSLMLPTFHRDLHTFLSSLHPLLLRRTGAAIGAARRRQAIRQSREQSDSPSDESGSQTEGKSTGNHSSINSWEIIHDEESLATIANVPSLEDNEVANIVGRADAVNLHTAALEILASKQENELERRIKTARGWWIGWARMPLAIAENAGAQMRQDQGSAEDTKSRRDSQRTEVPVDVNADNRQQPKSRQILLFRRANDAQSKGKNRVISGWSLGAAGLMGSLGNADNKLEAADLGIVFNARRYVEALLGTSTSTSTVTNK